MSFSCPGGLSQRNSPAGWTRRRQDWSAPMVIVAGHITVEPQQRESYLAGCVRIVEQARRAVGCLDVAICADLVDPGRVNISEAVSTSSSAGSRRRRWRPSAAAALTRNSARRCSRCPFRSTTSPTCGPCSGRRQSELAARSHARPMRSAPRCGHNEKDHHERKDEPMKLTTTTNVSVDGVMQGLGGPDEDRRGGFERGGWALPLFNNDKEAATFLGEVFQRADAFLFGRRTYEIFTGSWGTWDDPGDSPIWTALNTKPKYVASTTLTDPRWTNTTVLSSEVAAAVRELKARPGRELQVHGSGALFRWLLDNDLVDEMNLFTFPVVVGQGTRLFPDTGRDRALELVESRATPSGVTIQVYRSTGRPQYETATPDLNT